MGLTYDEIAEIIKLIDGSSCDELVVETGDIKLVVRRNGVPPTATAEYVERRTGHRCSFFGPEGTFRRAKGRSRCWSD